MNAQEIMTTDVVTIESDAPLARAIDLLAELDVRHLPVVNDGELVGMLSDRDLPGAGPLQTSDEQSNVQSRPRRRVLAVADTMSSDVVTVTPAASVPEVIELMVEERVGALPVVDGHESRLLGIVSYVDVLRAMAVALAE